MMNQYGQLAMSHWQTHAPQRYAEIDNPTTFFEMLGEQAMEQITSLAAKLEGTDRETEGYLEKVGRLNAARKQAEEIVLSDLVWIPAETTDDETFEEWMAGQSDISGPLHIWARSLESADTPEAREEAELLSPQQMSEELGLSEEMTQRIWDAKFPELELESAQSRAEITKAHRKLWEKLGRPLPV
ncbi:hypothetical protein [Microbacterium amylolyticum]|uniref:Uncharacterized protein n=1 Tax=Microbacterium amylolyticum TaxID=936337 RepID=A0ABS4ZI42_9MICO|nr:hypothetical protein [Microbacterium amylolyticum]MBP2436942.1 hypothetical protein [Microbacterium amylolyticum]